MIAEQFFALIDIQMPEINGYEAAKMLRAEFGAGVWIYALMGSPIDMPTASHCGFDGVLAKPISESMLRACCAAVAQRQAPPGASAPDAPPTI